MPKISEHVASFIGDNAGLVLDTPAVTKQLRRAVRFYSGYRSVLSLRNFDPITGEEISSTPVTASNEASGANDIELTASEYSIIEPLFKLYVEEQNAIHLEASRGLGVDPYGRGASEVAGEISRLEDEYPFRCFVEPASTI